MDLNTGTPIQNPSTQVPPVPQPSPSLPTFTKQDIPAQIPPVVSVDNTPATVIPEKKEEIPPVSTAPASLPPLDDVEHSSEFIDTLSAIKKYTDAPVPTDIPATTASIPSEVVPSVQTVQNEIPTTPMSVPPTVPVPVTMSVSSEPTVPRREYTNAEKREQPIGVIEVTGSYEITALLDLVVQKNASDLHVAVGYPPMIRIDGDLLTVGHQILDPKMAKELIYVVLPDEKKEQLEVNREVDLAYQHKTEARFRINAYWQRGYLSAAFRLIPNRIRTIDELKLPSLFHRFTEMEQGLVLVTGPTGHGKSTTLASVIQEINMKYPKHILTIEDPIEYVFPQEKALVSQRELGDDTHSWKGALRSALREDPDVVLVGEMRDLETISAAITVAETGHLVFATLHTNSAAQTVQRIVNMYPDMQQEEIRTELADVLEAVVAQRLIPIIGGGRRAALEIMLMTPAVRNLIRENKIYQIDNIIRTSLDIGMITLERSLLTLFREGLLSQEDALRYALDATEMARLLEELV